MPLTIIRPPASPGGLGFGSRYHRRRRLGDRNEGKFRGKRGAGAGARLDLQRAAQKQGALLHAVESARGAGTIRLAEVEALAAVIDLQSESAVAGVQTHLDILDAGVTGHVR